MSPLLSMFALLAVALESPVPPPATPGSAYALPEHPTAEGRRWCIRSPKRPDPIRAFCWSARD